MINPETGLTPKQEKFAKTYLDTGNATEAVRQAGYDVKSNEVARSIGSENLTKPNVLAFLSSHAQECASIILELAKTAENETVRLNASKDVLDRAGFKPTDKSEVRVEDKRVEKIEMIQPNGHNNATTNTETVSDLGETS